MKDESEPITDDEWLLRRIPRERFCTGRTPVVSPNAFEPRVKGREPDTGGISLYRAACLADASEILATVAPERRGEYAIVRVPVSLLTALGLTVRSAPDEKVKGHVVIPELNADEYAAGKARFTPIKLGMAEQASKEGNIVKRPDE